MNWKRIKSIFIILFLFTNIFLVIYSSYTYYAKVRIQPELAEKVITVMENNGITISDSIIPRYKSEVVPLTLLNTSEAEEKLSQKLLGSATRDTNSSGEMFISSSGAYLVLRGGTAISCGKIDAKGTESEAAEEFVSMLDTKLSKHFLISSNGEKNEYVFGQYIDGCLVDGAELNVRISGGKIFASGTYIYSPVVPMADKNYSDPLNVILKFLGSNSKSTEISDMIICYIMEKSISSTSLSPAYRITDENGFSYFFDAVTGERLK